MAIDMSGVYCQGVSIAEGAASSAYFPSEKYTIEMTRDELVSYYAALRSRLEQDCGHRQYHRGRRGAALR